MDEGIKCIFYAEFDNTTGPKIIHQAPKGYLSPQKFDEISGYVITGPKLSHQLVSLSGCGHRILGYPIRIENSKYDRNALLFNVCFMFDLKTDTSKYESTVCKLASTVETLEHEAAFLSTPETKRKLGEFLPLVLDQLNNLGECLLRVHESNLLALKIVDRHDVPKPVKPHQVPILIRDVFKLVTSRWDLTVQQVMPYIDGVRHAKRISTDSNIDLSLVSASLRQLLFYKCIKLIDIFQFSNVYTPTKNVNSLFRDTKLQSECLQYTTFISAVDPIATKATSFPTIFKAYCKLSIDTSIGRFYLEQKLSAIGLDLRRFVTFGLLHGIIRRVHRYPTRIRSQLQQKSPGPLGSKLESLMDGNHCFDELCITLNLTHQEILEKVHSMKDCIVVLR